MTSSSEKQNAIAKPEVPKASASERFYNMVVKEFCANTPGELAISDFQRRLIQDYFVAIDMALKAAEEKRQTKKTNKDALSITWENINQVQLARDAVRLARQGLDAAQKNHINFIPYKNNTTNKYDLTFIIGYVGLEYRAKKYAQEMPVDVITELVYSSDTFRPVKKSAQNRYESYEFDINNPFDRGEIIGGFAYYAYPNPDKNRLMVMTMKDIEKRRPKYASVEFWGGEKDKWEDGKKVGKEIVSGWLEEMCLKTIKRAAYGAIALDPQKIDEDYLYLRQREGAFTEIETEERILVNGNKTVIDIETGEIIEESVESKVSISEPANNSKLLLKEGNQIEQNEDKVEEIKLEQVRLEGAPY